MEENKPVTQKKSMAEGWKRRFALIYAGQAFSLIGSSAVQFAMSLP